ncbi:pyrrolo-quinoline quinone [Polymorphobacter glacialis]|uniref:Pyrrolo-quinoline quinone n=1 Tax=Sandarakinorhabdus glacialis TaxID=1614636 RepID=A0A916ZSM6_9SPHN|nr:PQQ-binding-like beta-propeller repeat protein [Polymorphobacter glacialis]GGE11953.1 pyrrolo-quinoline quinone [Polymorphobacter glacialis]
MHSQILRKQSVSFVVVAALALSGCGIFKGGKTKTPTLGERIPVLNYETRAVAEPELQDLAIVLPPAEANADWAQSGGSASKANGHLALPETVAAAWSVSIGAGSSGTRRLNSGPIVMDGRVFTMDTGGDVRAFDATTGAVVWQSRISVAKKNSNAAFGGGVGGGDGRIFATTGYGIVAAFDSKTGAELWRKTLGAPLRGAPAVANNRVFVVTQDNQIFALNAEKGDELWTVAGTVEVAGLLGVGAPAVAQDTVVVGFSSGELNALRAENGRTVWSDALARTGRSTAMAALSDIDASPVIDRGRVYAIGHGGRMAALELATGQRAWERNFAGTSMPWVAGEFVFVVTLEGELLCLTRGDGKVRWMLQLPNFGNVKKKTKPIRWAGPVLASDRLIVAGSNKEMVVVSPYTGKIISTIKLSASAFQPPIVAGNTAYVLTDDGKLTAYR